MEHSLPAKAEKVSYEAVSYEADDIIGFDLEKKVLILSIAFGLHRVVALTDNEIAYLRRHWMAYARFPPAARAV